MLTTNNFLGCMKLETGGIIIGWLSLVSNIISAWLCLILIIMLSFFDCQDFKRFIHKNSELDVDEVFNQEGCNVARIAMIVALVIGVPIAIGFSIIAFLCIRGVEHRDHVRVRPLMIVSALFTIFALLGILSFTAYGIISSLFYALIYGYVFVVLYSLYDNFRQEYIGGVPDQYQVPLGKA